MDASACLNKPHPGAFGATLPLERGRGCQEILCITLERFAYGGKNQKGLENLIIRES